MTFNQRDFIYDIETYPNLFTNCIYHPSTDQWWLFEISDRRNDLLSMIEFLRACGQYKSRLIGYNNLFFDYPVLHYIFKHGVNEPHLIKQKAQQIINGDRFENIVWESDWLCDQIDLFKIHHFDNKAKSTSLKMLQFNMRLKNIQDLPYHHTTRLNDSQKDEVIRYNYNDVLSTFEFYKKSLDEISFREELSEQYDKNFLNHNDTKIGKDIFIHELEKAKQGTCWDYSTGRKKPRQTKRPLIYLNDIIFPYIQFERPEFQRLLNWLKNYSITKTKGALEYLKVTPEMAMNMNPEVIKVHGLSYDDLPNVKPNKTLDRQLKNGLKLSACKQYLQGRNDLHKFEFISGWKDQSGLNVIVDGFEYTFGTGGIHGSVHSQTVYSDNEKVIIDLDVASYYPNIAIANRLYPEHLGGLFCEIYKNMYERRVKIKKQMKQLDKKDNEYKRLDKIQKALKLALNGTYGDSNNEYSPFYDPQFTMSITINGQLLLCVLAEQLIKIPGLEMIQINTDGLTVRCPRQYIENLNAVWQWWEQLTLLELEENRYSRMFIRDVNNYIAEYEETGELKRKGAYEYEREWHKNHSALIIQKAAEASVVKGIPVDQFIYGHTDLYDFMLRTKVPKDSILKLDGKPLQNITRFYISNSGGNKLTKFSPPKGPIGAYKRKNGITDEYYNKILSEVGDQWDPRIHTKNKSRYQNREMAIQGTEGWRVTECNDISKADPCDINYDYYIKETRKLIEPLTN